MSRIPQRQKKAIQIVPSSTRLQQQAFKTSYPKEYEAKDKCILFFPNEVRYSLVDTRSLVDPTDNVSAMSVVTVKDGKRTYKATLMLIGTELECKQKIAELEKQLNGGGESQGESDSESECSEKEPLGKDITAEMDKLQQLEEKLMLQKDTGGEVCDDLNDICSVDNDADGNTQNPGWQEWRASVDAKLDEILNILRSNSGKRRVSACTDDRVTIPEPKEFTTPPSAKRIKHDGRDSPCSSESASLIYKDTDLLSIHTGGNIKKYALKVFSLLFNEEEMRNGAIGPLERTKTKGKVELDIQRVSLLKRAIAEKYGEQTLAKKWAEIRKSCNQKCLDKKSAHEKLQKALNTATVQ